MPSGYTSCGSGQLKRCAVLTAVRLKRLSWAVDVVHMVTRAEQRFTVVLVVVLVAILGVQISGVDAQRSSDRAADDRVRLTRAVEQIRGFDEVLTTSARLAALSGDNMYVQRYEQAVPELDRVLADALATVSDPQANRAVRATDQANRALIALEAQSFARASAGDRAGAYASVTSGEYEGLKAQYRDGMNVALERLRAAGLERQTTANRRQQVSLGIGIAAALLLAALWAATARGLQRSQRARGRAEEQLRVQAHSDPLTGLANRRLFREHLTDALEGAGPEQPRIAVLFADLDHFKTVNDTRGHAEGDALLVEVADRLTDLLHGHAGALVARLGGDEFAVLLRCADGAAAEHTADRVVAALSRPYAAAPQVPVTASVGVSVAPIGERDPGLILRGADLAMYAAKSAGRGRWTGYAEHMHSDLMARVELESQLREGLHRGELVVHYQPTQHLRTGAAHGVEALVRWQHPTHGLLGPACFIPLAESSDLIVDLGRFVLEQACRQLSEWRETLGDRADGGSAPVEVAVNVSPRELAQPGYAAQVMAVLHLNALPPERLVLEVTESAIMTEQDAVVEMLTELRAAGVRIAIDDFGTGHSSLARLADLPVDQVKIDRSFIVAAAAQSGHTQTAGATMLDLLVTLAERLQLDLVAEGIETTDQLEVARDAGCTYGQGFLLGRPAPAAALWAPSRP